ncbi:MAG TPA: MauE/DoxX family redox-associated membrane protein, partial [Nitrosopumilaceae archaeon]|nr:MauE/DoxX family redox-associated membrane protein [Nitrosopumilaceae archaeon]
SAYPRYELKEQLPVNEPNEIQLSEGKSWIVSYWPVLSVFIYISGITFVLEWMQGSFVGMRWMQHFMAGFFLVFSFFKFLNLNGFADSYAMYDIIAMRIKAWAYVYAFIELGLGISYLAGFNPFVINLVTLIIMSVSITGVIKSVVNKKKIRCACLGDVFNLPMSTLTIIEDVLMILMSAGMLACL